LLALYRATAGSGWAPQTWNTTSDPCKDFWFGVKCFGVDVQAITIQKNNLVGTIPPELGLISTLNFLYLSNNRLRGTIPSQLGGLVHLQQLGLDVNGLSGVIPKLQSPILQSVFLQQNQLQGGLDSLTRATILQYLYLSHNQLTGTIPEDLAIIKTLQELGLDDNQLTGTIPVSFGLNQFSLQGFYLQANNLTGRFPGSSLSQVKACDCSRNQFSCPIPQPPVCGVIGCVF